MITDKQRERRKQYIGASDVPALFGLDDYKNIADVWASKVLDLPEKDVEWLSRGNRYEKPLIQFVEEQEGRHVITDRRRTFVVCPHQPALASNLDGFIAAPEAKVVECKTSVFGEKWGEPGTDEVPFAVNLQVQAQMLCSGIPEAYVAALLGRRGAFEGLFVVKMSKEIQSAIIARVQWFVDAHVSKRIPPDRIAPLNIDILRKMKREPLKYADVQTSLITEWEEAKRLRLDAEKYEDDVFGRILLELGDAEGAFMDDGRVFTFFEQGKRDINREYLREKYPDIYEECQKQTFYRVARIKKEK